MPIPACSLTVDLHFSESLSRLYKLLALSATGLAVLLPLSLEIKMLVVGLLACAIYVIYRHCSMIKRIERLMRIDGMWELDIDGKRYRHLHLNSFRLLPWFVIISFSFNESSSSRYFSGAWPFTPLRRLYLPILVDCTDPDSFRRLRVLLLTRQ